MHTGKEGGVAELRVVHAVESDDFIRSGMEVVELERRACRAFHALHDVVFNARGGQKQYRCRLSFLDYAAGLTRMIPQNYVKLEGKVAQQMLKLMDALDDQDDVQHVWSNFDIEEKEIEASLA